MTCCKKVACYPGNVKECILYVYVLMGLKGLLLNKLSIYLIELINKHNMLVAKILGLEECTETTPDLDVIKKFTPSPTG